MKTCPNCSMVIPEPLKVPKIAKRVLTEEEKKNQQFKRLATTLKKLRQIDNQKVLEIINLN